MPRTKQIPTPQEYRTLVEAAHERSLRHGFTVYLLGRTGMLRGEAAHFAPEWFDAVEQGIAIPRQQDGWSRKSKYRARWIPLPSCTTDNMIKYIDELDDDAFDVSGGTIYDRVTAVSQNLDIRATPSVLRRMYGTLMISSGIPERVVASMLGLRVNTASLGIQDYYTSRSRLDSVNMDQYWSAEVEPDIW